MKKRLKKTKQTNLKSIYCGIIYECSLGKKHKANPRKKPKKQKSKENLTQMTDRQCPSVEVLVHR